MTQVNKKNHNEHLESIIDDLYKLEGKINNYINNIDVGLESIKKEGLANERLASFILDMPDETLPGMNNLELKQLIYRFNQIKRKIHENNDIKNNNKKHITPKINNLATLNKI